MLYIIVSANSVTVLVSAGMFAQVFVNAGIDYLNMGTLVLFSLTCEPLLRRIRYYFILFAFSFAYDTFFM